MSEITWNELTLDEQRVLKKIDVDGSINIKELPLETWHSIYAKNLVSFAYGGLTPEGDRVLAQASDPQPVAGDDDYDVIMRGWIEAKAQSWYLNATPSDNPEGEEVIKPEIIAGKNAFEIYYKLTKTELATLHAQLAASERQRHALAEAVAPFVRCYQQFIDSASKIDPMDDDLDFGEWFIKHVDFEAVHVGYVDLDSVVNKLAAAASDTGADETAEEGRDDE